MNKYILKICLALFFDSGVLNGSNSDDFHFVVVGDQLTELTLDSVGHLDVFFGFVKTVKWDTCKTVHFLQNCTFS